MAKVQTRRSISVKGEVYERVKRYCEDNNVSMSGFIEERILEHLGGSVRRAPRNTKTEIAQHFTF